MRIGVSASGVVMGVFLAGPALANNFLTFTDPTLDPSPDFADLGTVDVLPWSADPEWTGLLDSDGDGVPDEGFGAPCTTGETAGCNDNCPFEPNNEADEFGPAQRDFDGDGQGDLCECGNVDRNRRVDIFDALAIAQGTLTPPLSPMPHPRACDVDGNSDCDIFDALLVAQPTLTATTDPIVEECPALVGPPAPFEPPLSAIVIPDRNADGTTTAGIKEAIESTACNAANNGCTIQLEEGIYDFSCDRATFAQHDGCLEIFERNNITFRGAGIDRTTIRWQVDGDVTDDTLRANMIRIYGDDDDNGPGGVPEPSTNIRFEDMTIYQENTCLPGTDTCQATAQLPAVVKLMEVDGVYFDRVRIRCTSKHGDYSTPNQLCRGIWAQGDVWRETSSPGEGGQVPSRGVHFVNSVMESSGRGLEFHSCEDCSGHDSLFRSPTAVDPAMRPTAQEFFVKYEGKAVRFYSNTLDADGYVGATAMVKLTRMINGINNSENMEYVQIDQNSFMHMTDDQQGDCTAANEPYDDCDAEASCMPSTCPTPPVMIIEGYSRAHIADNWFLCDESTNRCSLAGIWFRVPNGCTGGCNRYNVVESNYFHHWRDSRAMAGDPPAGAGHLCPIRFDPPEDLVDLDDPNNDNVGNVIRNNVFDLRGASGLQYAGDNPPGFCWSLEAYHMSHISGNVVVTLSNNEFPDSVLEEHDLDGQGDPTFDGEYEYDTESELLLIGDDGLRTHRFKPQNACTSSQGILGGLQCIDLATEAELTTHTGLASAHHAEDHASRHGESAADELFVDDLGTTCRDGFGLTSVFGRVECTDLVTELELGVRSTKICSDWTVMSPAGAVDHMLFRRPYEVTITDIDCIVDSPDTGDSITITLRKCDETGDNCTTDVEAAITCDNDGASDTGGIDNGSIRADTWVDILYGARTGTVSDLTYTVCYTRTVIN